MKPGMALKLSGMFYGSIALLSVLWLVYRDGLEFFRPPPLDAVLPWMLVSALCAMAIVLFSRLVAETSWALAMEREMQKTLGPLTRTDTFFMAVFSGIGEELFFRGVLLPPLGLFGSSVIFCMAHPPYIPALRPWTLFAILMGFLLGYLYQASGSLWPPIFLHFAVNDQNLTFLARRFPRDGDPDLPP